MLVCQENQTRIRIVAGERAEVRRWSAESAGLAGPTRNAAAFPKVPLWHGTVASEAIWAGLSALAGRYEAPLPWTSLFPIVNSVAWLLLIDPLRMSSASLIRSFGASLAPHFCLTSLLEVTKAH